MAVEFKQRVLCVVMDGVGLRDSRFGNAVALAEAPTLKRLLALPLFTTLAAHGKAVGLPSDDDIGNSEVGHNALGAGRVFAQGAKLVNEAIASGAIFKGDTWRDVVTKVKTSGGSLHFLGLLSDGNVHSHEEHLFAMLRAAKTAQVARVRVHVLFDGRDVGQKTAETYIDRLEKVMAELRSPAFDIRAASGGGRMRITMDRYNAEWSMVERGWHTHVLAEGRQFPSLSAALSAYRQDPAMTDQHLPEFVVATNGVPNGPVQNGDAVVFYNFRGDRAIEISRAFTERDFKVFERGSLPDALYAGMMEYDGDLHIPPRYLVAPPQISHPLSEYLIQHGVRQFACSETQKFGHVTYFWNGNRSGYMDRALEEYVEIPSDPASEFQSKPVMKAPEITKATVERMRKHSFDFGRINFANGDMVGHTGDLKAAVQAVEAVDQALATLMKTADETGTTLLITADHGNADEMFDGKEKDFPDWDKPGGKKPNPKTAHTLAPVPCAIYGQGTRGYGLADLPHRSLGNVAATVIELLGLPANPLYLPSLLVRRP